ncbi:MAG: hypothetical protein CM15mP29_1800 [Alphaproteobacteria bacterium]|nr:MAG: hypothetical protein CM15mP29_1800 [Alphaproteobacteria bacterium]
MSIFLLLSKNLGDTDQLIFFLKYPIKFFIFG